jgi:hypothetical protein
MSTIIMIGLNKMNIGVIEHQLKPLKMLNQPVTFKDRHAHFQDAYSLA